MTNAQPLISIITPSLNQAPYISAALESVRSQGYPAWEHLVMDAGSQDGTQGILSKFAHSSRNGTLHWRSHPDDGQSSALNEGFSKAKGEIIGWLNADDRYRSGCFDAVARAFADHPEVDVLYGDYTFIDEAGRHVALRREIEFSHFILKYCHTLYIPTTTTFFRCRVFAEGYFLRTDLHYAMDVEFFFRLAEAGFTFRHLPRTIADFRTHRANKSTLFKEQQLAEHRDIVLSTTPLARRFKSVRTRRLASGLLRIPADAMRYSEKLLRGYYFPCGNAAQLSQDATECP